MTTQDWISTLSIIVLIGFIIALGYLIVFLHRANRIATRVDHLTVACATRAKNTSR